MDQLILTHDQIARLIEEIPYEHLDQPCAECHGLGVCANCYALDDQRVWGSHEGRQNPLCRSCSRDAAIKERHLRRTQPFTGPPADWRPAPWLLRLYPQLISSVPEEYSRHWWVEEGRYGICKACHGTGQNTQPGLSWLRQARRAAGVSARIFAAWLGVSYGYIMRIEGGFTPLVNPVIFAGYLLVSRDGPEAAMLRAAAAADR